MKKLEFLSKLLFVGTKEEWDAITDEYCPVCNLQTIRCKYAIPWKYGKFCENSKVNVPVCKDCYKKYYRE